MIEEGKDVFRILGLLADASVKQARVPRRGDIIARSEIRVHRKRRIHRGFARNLQPS